MVEENRIKFSPAMRLLVSQVALEKRGFRALRKLQLLLLLWEYTLMRWRNVVSCALLLFPSCHLSLFFLLMLFYLLFISAYCRDRLWWPALVTHGLNDWNLLIRAHQQLAQSSCEGGVVWVFVPELLSHWLLGQMLVNAVNPMSEKYKITAEGSDEWYQKHV